jgi:hypothetical protein
MQLDQVLLEAGHQGAFAEIGQAYGLSADQTQSLLTSVLPEFSRRIERNTLSRGGLADMVASMGDPTIRAALDNPAALTSPQLRTAGIGILDQVLGSKDKSRALAARAAQSTGLSEIIIKQLLPILAAMIMGGMAKSGGGSLGDILSKIPGLPGSGPGTSNAPVPKQGGGWSGFPLPGGSTSGPAAPIPVPRSDGSPLPLPGEHTPLDAGSGSNPYGDLSDVIRRGGGGGGIGTSSGLPGIIRSILGSLLGFQSGGLVSWIIRAVVMRYGWSILRFIFGRVLLGR